MPQDSAISVRDRKRRLIAAAWLAVLAGPAAAQSLDRDEFLRSAAEALGGPAATIEFTASGWDACLGQAWSVAEGWARWELSDYRRVIDYTAATSTQAAMRRPGLDPDRVGGCGAQVDAEAAPQQSSVRAGSGFAEQLPIWLTPHGFLRLADAAAASEIVALADGWSITLQVEREGTSFRLVASYAGDFLPRQIATWIDDPVFGDLPIVARFRSYRDFGGIRYPAEMTVAQGGMTTLELTIDSVTAGVEPPEIPPPRAPGGGGGGAGNAAAYTEIGDGVFVMLGAYQGVAVEFDEFAVVIDGMQSDARTQEIIRLTHEAIPSKPIRYIVNTHSHFDHASGLRQYVAAGATVLTHELNESFFREALLNPRTLNPGPIEPSRLSPVVEGIGERFEITDARGQRLEIIPLRASPHAADMLIAYLPSIATVVESDLLQPWINPIFAGSGDGPHPYLVYLADEIERHNLRVEQFVPVHNPPEPPTMPRAALDQAVGR